MTRKICVITGSRADYAHLYWLMKQIQQDKQLRLQTVVTGMHLSKEHGYTFKRIEKDGFKIDAKIPIHHFPNTPEGITKAMGKACQLCADAYKQLRPNMVVILGDRFEMFAAALAAYTARIPMVHIHGGELSYGVIDEAFRHAITKMSTLHFPATREYRRRIIQLGENPEHIFVYGSPSLEQMYREELLTKVELAGNLGFDLRRATAVVTYHPVTLGIEKPERQINNLLAALRESKLNVVFTRANNDAYGDLINKRIEQFCRINHEKYKLFAFLGQKVYFSCLKHLDIVVGNSSSGIIEAPSFRIPVVNIGDRQAGRIRSKNIIDTGYTSKEISAAIKKGLSNRFKAGLRDVKNPYQSVHGKTINYRIKEKIKTFPLSDKLLIKRFFDVPVNEN